MEVDKSSLIVSKAGRDKGQLFYVIDADEQYVYLADGKSRKLEKPNGAGIRLWAVWPAGQETTMQGNMRSAFIRTVKRWARQLQRKS